MKYLKCLSYFSKVLSKVPFTKTRHQLSSLLMPKIFSAFIAVTVLAVGYLQFDSVVETKVFLIQGETAKSALVKLNINPSSHLPLINALVAELSEAQVKVLQQQGLILTSNYQVQSAGLAFGKKVGASPASASQMTNASILHAYGIYGDGVTIAILDTGVKSMSGIKLDAYGRHRVYGTYDAHQNTTS
ncbi:MAG: subtilase family serine protease, partial [Enterobacterales bacterium]